MMKIQNLLFIIPVLILNFQISVAEEHQSCFCTVYGNQLEDCPCTPDTIDSFNDGIHPKMMTLLSKDFFRYFQVDFMSPCKWGWDATCMSPNCAVATCDPDTLPHHARKGNWLLDSLQSEESVVGRLWAWSSASFPILDTWLGDLLRWGGWAAACTDPYPQHHDVAQFCKLDPLASDSCDVVDLVANPEQFTGYSGEAARRVWSTIYDELCFHPEAGEKTLYLTPDTARTMCTEKRTFYRLVSGLHSSISVHLCSKYLLEEGNTPVWGRNFQEFKKRFSPESTVNEGPERIKNIYFLYLVELRAIAKVANILNDIKLNEESDKSLIKDLTDQLLSFPYQFQEADLFKDESLNNTELREMFKTNFMKISEIMDCLGCERCKVWGKLQVTGIGTALKILFSQEEKLSLTKHEIVALLNSFGRHSTSLAELKHFREANL